MKTIVISGGSRGLGLALGEYLYHQGYRVITFARGASISQIKEIVHLEDIDVQEPENFEQLEDFLSQADGLVNNVGMAYDGILATQGYESIYKMISVNLTSIINLTKFYLRLRLKKRLNGNVVTISSIISQRGFAGLSTYAATKGALNSLTLALAREMGSKGFRFNAVLPGYFESELSKSLSEGKKQQIIRRTPLGRLATTADICPLVEFLLSEQSSFITGQLISVDGGLTV
jgi:3-oxoacyl-[acyl-carrier protein] reductase